uniref:Uncharacterized protein n=1 Tax=Plectus sambesii TaxID=2011161 RepID=A0A914VYR8_9BILA
MDAIHNVVDKTKALFSGDSHTIDNDVVRAAEREEEMRHKMVQEQITADMKIAKAAEKVEKRQHELNLQNIRGNANIADAAHDCVKELRKQEVVGDMATDRINDTAVTAGYIETYQQPFIAENTGYPTIDTNNRARVVEQQFDARQDQLKSELKAEKDVYEAAEDLEKEGHKQNEKIMKGNRKLAKAVDELDTTILKKEEKRAAAEERIDEAAQEKMAVLQDRQVPQRCQDAMLEGTTGAPVDQTVYTRTEIH